MTPSRPILVALAGRQDDEAPTALARMLSELTGARSALVTAVASMRGGARESWESLEATASALPGDVEMFVRPGDPAHVVATLADELGAALVVTGSSHRGRVGRVLAGDTAVRILRADRAALAVAPRGYRAPEHLGRIAVGYDGSPEGRDALAAGVGLALLAGSEVTAFTVHAPAGRASRAEALATEALALTPSDVVRHAEVLEGEPARALSALSDRFDLLVCGSRALGAVRSMFLGSVTEHVIETASCPVLVLPREVRHVHGILHPRPVTA